MTESIAIAIAIAIGVSSCLLGEPVRYDGGHKRNRYITDILGSYFRFVAVCPEVGCGLPTPRESMRLEGDPAHPRLVTGKTRIDHTDRMLAYCTATVRELEKEDLCGFIFKSRSPSSGMERVKLYDRNGVPTKTGVGLFARVFMAHFPLLPVEEDGRLHDARLRENFVECLFVFQRWRRLLDGPRGRGELVAFHTRHKLLLLAHSTEIYRQAGKLVAAAKELPETELYARYQALLMKGMRLLPTVKKHVNVLQHLLGYFKRDLSAGEKAEVLELIDHYRQGHLPLIVPVTLVNHFVRKYGQPYLARQYYLHPHPLELQLRNHC